MLPASQKLDHPHSKMSEWGEEAKEERPNKKRRERAEPLEVELDLSGGISPGNMSRSSLEGENEARVASVGDFKHQEGLKMYIRLPDYNDFQGYYQGVGGILSRIARKKVMPISKSHLGEL